MIQVPDTEDDFVPNMPFIPVHLSDDRYPRPFFGQFFGVLCCFLFLLCGLLCLSARAVSRRAVRFHSLVLQLVVLWAMNTRILINQDNDCTTTQML